jgi:hypothetical protein
MPEPAQNITIVHSKNAKLKDTLFHIERIINEFSYQVRDIALQLNADSVEQTSRNIWNWTRKNIRYQKDENDIEQLRRPARIISDGYGDCDCMTILNRSLLRECRILNAAKTTAYPEKDKDGNYKKDFFGKYVSADFSHIYALSIDKKNRKIFVIDTVPEIPYFNYEYQPITKFLITPDMELHELGDVGETIFDTELSDVTSDEQELSGFDDELSASYETKILGRIAIVGAENATSKAVPKSELTRRVIIADLTKQKSVLEAVKKSSGPISRSINIDREIDVFDQVLKAADMETALKQAAKSTSYFAEYFGAMSENLQHSLNGTDDDEMVYLGILNGETEEEITSERLGKIKVFGKDGVLKKGLDVIKKISPLTITMRAAALVLIRANVFRIAHKLAIGYMTEDQAKAKGYNIEGWKKFVEAKDKFESKWKNFGGKTSALQKAVVKGRAGKKEGINGDLGFAVAAGVTAAMTAAAPVLVAIKDIFGKLNVKTADPKDSGDEGNENGEPITDKEVEQINNTEMEQSKTENLPVTQDNTESSAPEKKTFFAAVQNNMKSNKKWWIIGSIGLVLIILLFIWLANRKKKAPAKRRSLHGVPTRRKLKTVTTQIKQLEGHRRSLSGVSALKQRHARARKLKAAHPHMKYATALKKSK